MRISKSCKIVCSIVAILCCISLVQAKNLVVNPSFEDIEDNMPSAWTTNTWTGQAEFSIDNAGRTGNCVKIASKNGADVAWSQTLNLNESTFARLRLSGWVKTEHLRTTTGRGVQLNVLNIKDAITSPLTLGSDDWVKLETEFQLTGQDKIQINCLLGGWGEAAGMVWFDDISVEEIEEVRPESKVISTQISVDPEPRHESISKYVYGQFLEHMGRCIYGGIWAEMLEDRKFFYPIPAKEQPWSTTSAGARVLKASPWKIVGPKENVQMCTEEPLSGKHNPLIFLDGQPGGLYQDELGLLNGKEYAGRIVLKGDASAGPIQVSLIWGEGDANRQTVAIDHLVREFKTYDLKLKAHTNTENAKLEIIGIGKGSFTIGAVSLMPADNIKGFRKDTLELLKQLDSPIYRWPGGNFVSAYDWRDGLGDCDKRSTRSNPAWTGIETNDVGMHEFIDLCRLLNTEPLITVNTGFSDAYSAAAEVEYANGAPDSLMGKWRSKNGHKQPFHVKYWCVGNEMFGKWQLGYMQLHHYIMKQNWVEEMMRKVDPAIVTIASGDLGDGWSEGMLRGCYDNMNHIAEHFYCSNRLDLTEHARQIPNRINEKVKSHRRYRDELPMLQGKDIRIAMTEWNYWYGPNVFGESGTRFFMKDALGIAAGLHEYFRNSDMIHSAFYAQTVNVIGAIKTTKTAAEFDATAYPLVLYRREFGVKPLLVTGWDEKLDVSAALTEDGKFLTIGFVNATWDTYNVTLNLNGLVPKKKADGWVIHHDDPMVYNHPGKEPVVGIKRLKPTNITETLSIKPISVTVFKVSLK